MVSVLFYPLHFVCCCVGVSVCFVCCVFDSVCDFLMNCLEEPLIYFTTIIFNNVL